MSILRIHAKQLFDGQNFLDDHVLTVANGEITAIDENTENVDVYCNGLVTPGYVDLQVNGGGGALFNDSPSVDNIKTIITAHSKFGTTAMLPTLITDKTAVMAQAAEAISQAIEQGVPGIIGVHFEGPHLSVAKKGAHSAEFIRPISDEEWQILSRKDLGQVIVTLAPETVPPSDIARMVELGIKVCIGHSNADFQTAQTAIDAGADGFTHLYNAMSPIQGRELGVTGCALLTENTSCGLILDGHHVDYSACKLALKAKSKGEIYLVTDSMSTIGTDETEFAFFDRMVYLEDGKLTSTTGELAGSALDMQTAVINAHKELNLPLDEALRMASLYPAKYINQQSNRGVLTIGAQADFVVLNEDLTVQETWISGNKVYIQK